MSKSKKKKEIIKNQKERKNEREKTLKNGCKREVGMRAEIKREERK